MKVICQQKELTRTLNIVSRAVKTNSTLPVLDNILIKTEGKKLYFFSTNLEIAIECSMDVEVKNEGSITVPAKLFDSYISLLHDEEVELSVNNATDFHIKTKTSETKIKGIKAENFPSIPKVEKEGSFYIESEQLLHGITQTVFAVSMNTARPVLSGIYMHVGTTDVTFVTTDSYRLAEKKVKIKKADTSLEEFIVPYQTMLEVGRIFTKKEEDVEVIISKNQILFAQDNIKLISRLVEGRFPEYNQIIPKQHNSRAIMEVDEFLLAIKRISLFARENSYNIKLEIKKSGTVVISSNATEIGEGKTEVACEVEGQDATIALNAQYLMDFLNTVGEAKVQFDIDTKLTPAVFRRQSKGDYLYLVMPLKMD